MSHRGTPHGLPLEVRFWLKVDKSAEHWLWTASTVPAGYGQFRVSGPGEPQRNERAHRVAWGLTYGPIPDGLQVLHHCDIPPCVRPSCLFLGTRSTNMQDCVAKGRAARQAPRGERSPNAKLTEQDVHCIRAQRSEGRLLREIAAEFGIGTSQVRRIVVGESWSAVGSRHEAA